MTATSSVKRRLHAGQRRFLSIGVRSVPSLGQMGAATKLRLHFGQVAVWCSSEPHASFLPS